MATVIGQSGAWKEIADGIQRRGFEVASPADIEPLLSHLCETFQPSVQAKKAEITERVRMEEAYVAALRAEKGFWRTIRNWLSIRGRKLEIARFRAEESRCIAELSDNICILESVLNSRSSWVRRRRLP